MKGLCPGSVDARMHLQLSGGAGLLSCSVLCAHGQADMLAGRPLLYCMLHIMQAAPPTVVEQRMVWHRSLATTVGPCWLRRLHGFQGLRWLSGLHKLNTAPVHSHGLAMCTAIAMAICTAIAIAIRTAIAIAIRTAIAKAIRMAMA